MPKRRSEDETVRSVVEDWIAWRLVSDRARGWIVGPPPPQHPNRILIVGTYYQDKTLETKQEMGAYVRSQGIAEPVIHREPHSYLLADAFFGYDLVELKSFGDDFVPTLPRGVLVGRFLQWDLGQGETAYDPVDRWQYDDERNLLGHPLQLITNLCGRYSVPLIPYSKYTL